jgi:amino acid transporter
VIGSGIFLTQGEIARAVGPWGPLLFLLGALLSWPIALCFAEMTRHYPGTGGASLFAQRVFGTRAGFVIGWVMWQSGLIGGATVALGMAQLLPEWPAKLVAIGILLLLAGANSVGTRSGAWSNNLLALAKLIPLCLAALVGVFWLGPLDCFFPSQMALPPQLAWKAGLLAVLFTYSGFEEIALPAGETRDAGRSVSKALAAVLLGSALLYSLLQGIVSLQATADTEQPLRQTFSHWPWLAAALGFAAATCYASVNASIAFTTPRSLWTLANQGWLWSGLHRLHHGAPRQCIAISLLLTSGLVLSQNLSKLIELSVLASLLQQLSTSLAAWKVRGWRSRPGVPQLATLVCLALLTTASLPILKGMGISLLLGLTLTFVLPRRVDESLAA